MKVTTFKAVTVVGSMLLLSACSQFHVPPYSVRYETVNTLKQIGKETPVKLTVGSVSGVNQSETTIMCRGVGPIKTGSGNTFGHYMRDALTAELSIADIYLADSSYKIDLDFTEFDFASTSGNWTMGASVSVNGSSFPVEINHSFSPSWFGETACDQTAQAMLPATQEFIKKLVSDPGFSAAVRQ